MIAQSPADPRDSARLLVFNRKTGKADWSHVRDIKQFLPKNSVLVLNETKVIPARLFLTRTTGDRVGALWVGTTASGEVRVLAKGKFAGGEELKLVDDKTFTVEGRNEKELLLKPSFALSELQSLFEKHGAMPLPPYIDHSPLTEEEIKERYQAVFAKNPGSIAAPTASLHFTERLLKELEESGIQFARVTLHVHLGTFSPLTEKQWDDGALHTEQYVIEQSQVEKLEEAKMGHQPIIAVGTTALRTLESAFDERGECAKPSGDTNLFIREGYTFKMVDGLMTNFHVPKSSLLMLVSAFAGRENILRLYAEAMEKKMRFFSFGDCCLFL